MAYFYFNKEGFLNKIARNEEEKTKLYPFIQADNWIEKEVTEEMLEKVELEKVHLFLVNGEIQETSCSSSLNSPAIVKAEVKRYLLHVDAYLKNYVDEELSTFKTALENFTIPEEVITGEGEEAVSNYPLNVNLVELLRTNNITAYSLLNIL